MDLFAALASDPTALPLWAVFVFAAGMFPVGMLFSCRACCRCSYCTPPGELPDTVTVTFDGFVDEEEVQGPYLVALGATACHGSGFEARLAEPNGYPDTDLGPMTKLEIVNGGAGYALLGRVEPTLTVGGGSGTGADLEVTLSGPVLDECDVPTWGVASVAITSGGDGGTGYVDGEQLEVSVSSSGSSSEAAVVIARTTKTEPEITATPPIGSDAELTVVVEQTSGEDIWYVSEVTVDDGGTGYSDGSEVAFSVAGQNVEGSPAWAVIHTTRSEPTLVELYGGTGTSAVLGASITANTGSPATWGISSVTITDGGAGYEVGDFLLVNIGSGDVETSPASVMVDGVDGAGAITSVEIGFAGQYHHDDGVIASVEVYGGGEYWNDDGVIATVEVQEAGEYYEEDPSQTPYVADVDVVVSQFLPSQGAGAVLTAVVDDDTSSETFGQIIEVTIDDGGDDYLAWQWLTEQRGCCGSHYNGLSVVARRGLDGDSCEFVKYFCGTGSMFSRHGRVVVTHNGSGEEPGVELSSEWIDNENLSVTCSVGFGADESIIDCDAFGFVATSAGGATATVEPGGDFDEADGNPDYDNNGFPSCNICCRGTSQAPREINVLVTDNRPGGNLGGEYILEAEVFEPYLNVPTRVLRWAFFEEEGGTVTVPVELRLLTTITQYRDDYKASSTTDEAGNPEFPCFHCTVEAVAIGGYSSLTDYRYAGPICAPSGTYELRYASSGNPGNAVLLTIEVL